MQSILFVFLAGDGGRKKRIMGHLYFILFLLGAPSFPLLSAEKVGNREPQSAAFSPPKGTFRSPNSYNKKR